MRAPCLRQVALVIGRLAADIFQTQSITSQYLDTNIGSASSVARKAVQDELPFHYMHIRILSE